MANRVYLCCTDFSTFPAESQLDEFFKVSGTEYEANYSIPLFWLCLFSIADIRVLPASHNRADDGAGEEEFDDDELDNESDDVSRPYAYLFCSKAAGIERLKSRADMLEKALGSEACALYGQWMARLEAEPFQHILVRTEELDVMGREGELEEQLREACKDLDDSCQQDGFRMTDVISNIVGLAADADLTACESYLLVGSANARQVWPSLLFAQPACISSESTQAPQKKSKWIFWK